jgi:hypothetical protein
VLRKTSGSARMPCTTTRHRKKLELTFDPDDIITHIDQMALPS